MRAVDEASASLRLTDLGLKDGEVVAWGDRFGRNPRIGLIAAEDKDEVLVHGVGVDGSGNPVAAMITREKQGKKTTGVIALRVAGLNVKLQVTE